MNLFLVLKCGQGNENEKEKREKDKPMEIYRNYGILYNME